MPYPYWGAHTKPSTEVWAVPATGLAGWRLESDEMWVQTCPTGAADQGRETHMRHDKYLSLFERFEPPNYHLLTKSPAARLDAMLPRQGQGEHQGQPHRQVLHFTTTSLRNVVISNASDVIFYEVITPKWEPHLTKISRLDPNSRDFNLIGELHWESAGDEHSRRKGKGKSTDVANDIEEIERESDSADSGSGRGKEQGARPVKMRFYGGAFKPTRDFLREQSTEIARTSDL